MHCISQILFNLLDFECIRAANTEGSDSIEQPELLENEALGPFPIAIWDGQTMHANASSHHQNFWNSRNPSLQRNQNQNLSQRENHSSEQPIASINQSPVCLFIQNMFRSIWNSTSNEANMRQTAPFLTIEENPRFKAQIRIGFESNLDFIKTAALTKEEPLVNELFFGLNEKPLAILTFINSDFEDLLNTDSWKLLIQDVDTEKDVEKRYRKGKKLLSVLLDLRKKLEEISQNSRLEVYKNYMEGYWNDIWKLIYYYSGNDLDADPITCIKMEESFSIPHDGKTRYVVNRATLFSLKYKNPVTGKRFCSQEIQFEKELWEHSIETNRKN